jgi:hypothetical protein
LIVACRDQNTDISTFKGPYLGQKTPGLIPELFAPEIFSKTHPEWAFCTEFTPDGKEFYFSECDTARDIDRIMFMKREGDFWTKPELVSFSGEYNDNDQRLSPDGNTIFWRSWRPLPGNDTPEERSVIWYATRADEGWSEAKPVKYGNTYLIAGYPSITKDGILYLSMRKDFNKKGKSDIFYASFNDGYCDTPKNLGDGINTEYTEGDLYIAPDESFLIVSCWHRPDNNGESDLYISFRDNGLWTELKNMGKPINTENNENCPSFSPDGKYFFYMSADLKNKPYKTYTYWVDAKIIENLKSKILK